MYKNSTLKVSEKQICGAEDASNLKNLVFYLRYGARPRGLKQEDLNLLQSVCEKNRIWEFRWKLLSPVVQQFRHALENNIQDTGIR